MFNPLVTFKLTNIFYPFKYPFKYPKKNISKEHITGIYYFLEVHLSILSMIGLCYNKCYVCKYVGVRL